MKVVVGDDLLLASLRAAVDAAPDDVALRVHLAELLADAGEGAEAVRQLGAVLQREPLNRRALGLIAAVSGSSADGERGESGSASASAATPPQDAGGLAQSGSDRVLAELEAQLRDVVPPRFADAADDDHGAAQDEGGVKESRLRLADVAGMAEVKARLEAAVLAPMRNRELAALYGKSLHGGLLLYGPPGCGKTFIARALAGEMGARFLPVSLAEILDMYVGQSERNVRELFERARRYAPCVIFLDEVDAIGQKRSQLRLSGTRGAVTQLLAEMDGVPADNHGVFVLGATNHPWDVDVALRRPGRFDRMALVLPPDEPARQAILRFHLQERPVANVDLGRLARRTEGFSGADLAHVCEIAAESALLDSARLGTPRLIEMRDLQAALAQVRPSVGDWLQVARNVAQFANDSGVYDDLLRYLKSRRLA